MGPNDPEETRYVLAKLVLRGSGKNRYYSWEPINPEEVHIQTIEEAEPMKHAHWVIANKNPDFVCSSCYCISLYEATPGTARTAGQGWTEK